MVKSTRCFSFKINDFVSIGAMRIPIWCVWAPKTNGLRRVDISKQIGSGFGSAFMGVRASKIIIAAKNCIKKCNFE